MSLASAGVLAAAASPARADFISAPDVVVLADRRLRAVLRAAGDAYLKQSTAPVVVMVDTGQGSVELIARGSRSDVLVTRPAPMDNAGARNLLKPGTRFQGWRTGLVIAARAGAPPVEMASALPAALGGGKLAVTDPTPASDIDSAGVLAALGVAPLLDGRTMGCADTGDVCFLVETGAAPLGLVTLADVRARPALTVAMTIPDTVAPPLVYAAAVTSNLLSRYAEPFHTWLQGDAATAILKTHGLERTS